MATEVNAIFFFFWSRLWSICVGGRWTMRNFRVCSCDPNCVSESDADHVTLVCESLRWRHVTFWHLWAEDLLSVTSRRLRSHATRKLAIKVCRYARVSQDDDHVITSWPSCFTRTFYMVTSSCGPLNAFTCSLHCVVTSRWRHVYRNLLSHCETPRRDVIVSISVGVTSCTFRLLFSLVELVGLRFFFLGDDFEHLSTARWHSENRR